MTDDPEAERLETAADEAIAACGGNPREAVKALLLAQAYLKVEVERLAEAVSRGFTRGRSVLRLPSRTDTA